MRYATNSLLLFTISVLTGALRSSSLAEESGDRPRPRVPTITVTGHGEATTPPDLAVVRLGAVAQAEQARDAQDQVNRALQESIKQLTGLGVPTERITTTGLQLAPVYSQQVVEEKPEGGKVREPRIVAYRASSTVQAEVSDLKKLGAIVDAVVAAGANQLEGVSFQRKNDDAVRREAMQQAAKDAQDKASALADALGVRLAGIQQVTEGGGGVRPLGRMDMMAAGAGAVVQPGQIRIDADVTVEYRIAEQTGGGGGGAAPFPAPPR